MKTINTPTNHDWGKDIVKDLAFIKKHKRYPFNKKTITPATITSLCALLIARISLPIFFSTTSNSSYLHWMSTLIIIAMILAIVLQYKRVMSFDEIGSPYSEKEHIMLVKKFLSFKQLAFTQHTEAHEVFIIISKNLNTNPKKEYREVMVFIADDKRILVNSHFVGNRFSIAPPSGNYKKMAAELHKWLNTNINSSQSLTVK